MRTKNITKHLILGALILTTGNVVGQTSVLGNMANGPTDFLGWNSNAVNNFPLEIRHDGAFPIQFWTSGSFRGLINERVMYPSLNTFPNIPADGFTLITPDMGFLNQPPSGPFSRLHLAEGGEDGNAEQFGYRPWQRNGVTFTGNTDQGYIGQKFREGGEGETDMVIQWSDNPGVDKADRLRFIFTSAYDYGATTGMNSEEGLEGMRLWPTWENRINVGIGDFYLYGGDPTERLHVRDGRVRIQELPDNPAADNLTRFMVVDDTPGAEYGVVKWRTLPVIPPPAPSCEWTLLNNGVSGPAIPHHVYSAVGVSDACPDASDAVGIGVNLSSTAPTAKLTVATTTFATGASISATTAAGNTVGLAVAATGGGASVRGVQAITNGTSTNGVAHAGDFISFDASNYAIGAYGAAYAGNFNAGFRGVSFSNGMSNFGVLGESRSNGLINVGVYASQGTGSFASPVAGNYGLFATTHNPSTGWAGWFQGDVMINGNGFLTGMIPILSDASLKTNVQAITDASQLLVQLQPKTYDFLVAEHPEIALSLEPQIGFIAQEVEQVLPQLVKQVTIPATLDSTGAELTASEDIKALNYIGIIPLLVAGYQEQQATIAQMQAQLDQCCAANPGMAPGGDGSLKSAPAKEDVQEQRLVIHPNPFTDHTTLSYYVPQAGKVSLQVSTSDGKPMGTLREEQAEAGAFTYEWNTSKLASGTYFCTFMLDGNLVVKRAVRVAR